jgi:hypothetical protein
MLGEQLLCNARELPRLAITRIYEHGVRRLRREPMQQDRAFRHELRPNEARHDLTQRIALRIRGVPTSQVLEKLDLF